MFAARHSQTNHETVTGQKRVTSTTTEFRLDGCFDPRAFIQDQT